MLEILINVDFCSSSQQTPGGTLFASLALCSIIQSNILGYLMGCAKHLNVEMYKACQLKQSTSFQNVDKVIAFKRPRELFQRLLIFVRITQKCVNILVKSALITFFAKHLFCMLCIFLVLVYIYTGRGSQIQRCLKCRLQLQGVMFIQNMSPVFIFLTFYMVFSPAVCIHH